MKTRNLFTATILVLAITFLASCSNDDDATYGDEKSQTNFYMTDAPTDNSNVKGVIVTVADIKVNGVSLEGFTKTTIDLMQYQNGMTKLLGNLELNTGTYSNISILLDNETDESGNAPGSYVLFTDGSSQAVATTTNQININDSFEILASTTNDIVFDFDIRKSLVFDTNGTFKFVSTSELSNSIRVINKEKSSDISGNASDPENTSDKIIVYAYEKGKYNANTEESEQGSGVTFSHAVTSSVVSNISGSYELNFLEEGEYELHFVSYTDNDNNGEFEFNGELMAESITGADLNNISINSSLNLNIAVTLKTKS
ncbi:MAG: DUF4382 domain-containing protein [Lutibacter sp.]|uniref:DUF4382 domain-containing protein n=1 Tax=Lutibacter sp. TaxID=1925666 RepID=UPI0018019D92|nr:DUF4382 domain-containing protein [Lutibacter sp.]MBT8317718.1 DUF4382 domain-containing protein [Lutibacter sp.]NNJ58576.1 DUF4382 domain-containing protein [Lutibacter sp.]